MQNTYSLKFLKVFNCIYFEKHQFMVSLIASDMHFIKFIKVYIFSWNIDIDIQYFKIFLNATLKREFNT